MSDDASAGAAQRRLADVSRAAALALGASSAVVVLFDDSGPTLAYVSDPMAQEIESQQHTVGEGPSLEAFRLRAPVIVNDLKGEGIRHRWPMLAGTVVDIEVGRVAAFPVDVGGIRLGVLTIYSRNADRLNAGQLAAGLLSADTAALALLDAEQELPGVVPLSEIGPVLDYRIHQATGIVMAQTGRSAHDALTRLRARAFTEGLPLQRLAHDVIARRVRFERESG